MAHIVQTQTPAVWWVHNALKNVIRTAVEIRNRYDSKTQAHVCVSCVFVCTLCTVVDAWAVSRTSSQRAIYGWHRQMECLGMHVINYMPNNNHSARMSIDTNVFYSSHSRTHARTHESHAAELHMRICCCLCMRFAYTWSCVSRWNAAIPHTNTCML